MIHSFVVVHTAPPVRANHRDSHRGVRLRAAFTLASAENVARQRLQNSVAKGFERRFSFLTSREKSVDQDSSPLMVQFSLREVFNTTDDAA